MGVDVLIPHFESLSGIEKTLASVENQTWSGNIRIVIHDDGSSDKTFRTLEKIASNFSKVGKITRSKTNQGRPSARNHLLSSVKNDFVSWLDADDIWLESKLQKQFNRIYWLVSRGRDLNYTWVTCDYYWQWENSKRRLVRQEVHYDQIKDLLIGRRLRAYLWTLLGTAESFFRVGQFDTNLPRLQDLDYFIRFAAQNGVLDKGKSLGPLCLYNKSDIGRQADEVFGCNEHILRKHRNLYWRYGPGFVRTRRFYSCLHAARFAKNNKSTHQQLKYLLRAFAIHPRLGAAKLYAGLRP